jgi:hypothetical protein
MITTAADDPAGVVMQAANAAGTPEAQVSTGMLRAAIETIAIGLTAPTILTPHKAIRKKAGRLTASTPCIHDRPNVHIMGSTGRGPRVKLPAPS